MRRWAIVIFVVVIVIALTLGASLQLFLSLQPQADQNTILPFVLATGLTVIIANAVIAIMQWFGKSPLDFLPEKTLREKDPQRYKLSRSKDPAVLREQTDQSMKLNEYDWAALFAEAWVNLKPGESRAYREFGKALIELNEIERAKDIGTRLIKLQKLNYEGYYLLGKAYSELAEWDEARRYFEQALLYAPDSFQMFILTELAEVFEATGDVEEAIRRWSTAEALQDVPAQKLYMNEKINHLKQIAERLSTKNDQ